MTAVEGFFSSFRFPNLGGFFTPTYYPPQKTAVTVDVLETGLIFSAVILYISLLLIIPALRNDKVSYFFRISISLLVTISMFLVNFGQEWEYAEITTQTQYRAGLHDDINATISVKIGLRSVNITLKTEPSTQMFGKVREIINYNERFSWDNEGWTQGRMGFGPNAGRINQEYRSAQWKGLPYPILWIAEYFTIDGENIRWGRFYRQAGFYTHIAIWLAFPIWVLTLMFSKMVVDYTAYFSILTGCILGLGNIIYSTIRNPLPLVIPVGDDKLTFSYGWCFYLNAINAIICLSTGLCLYLINSCFYDKSYAYDFLDIDITTGIEEIYESIPSKSRNADRLNDKNEAIQPKKQADIDEIVSSPNVDNGSFVSELSNRINNQQERQTYKRIFTKKKEGNLKNQMIEISRNATIRGRRISKRFQNSDMEMGGI